MVPVIVVSSTCINFDTAKAKSRGFFLPRKSTVLSLLLWCCSASLIGCGAGSAASHGGEASAIAGRVHGGQQPISGAAIQLYTVGSTGLASAATPMLTKSVTSGDDGSFDITNLYTCGESSTGDTISSGSDQVYIVATGGNPGLNPAVDNKALVLVAALGACSNLPNASYVEINEVTTVAAAWALAPFMTSATQVGATGSNPDGITNAFLDSALLADTTTGAAATIATNLKIETGKLYSLANALAGCVNSDGTTGCTPLFSAATPSGGTPPRDTLSAALNVVKHPGQNVAAVYKAISSTPPFVANPTTQPNDWTMSLTITGGGLSLPTAIGIDSHNNIWAAGQDSPLSEFGPQGQPLNSTGYGYQKIAQVYSLAIDTLGDIWVTNYNGSQGSSAGSVTRFYGADSTQGTTGDIAGDYSSGVSFPYAVSANSAGQIFIGSNNNATATVYNTSGTLLEANLGAGSGVLASSEAIAADASGGFWLSDNDDTVAHFSSTGALLSHPSCCAETYGIATDAAGNLWVADYLGGPNSSGAFAEIVTDDMGNATAPIQGSSVGGIDHPAFVAVDGAQNVWFTNYYAGSITEIAGSNAPVPGAAISPTVGSLTKGGYGLDASLDGPLGIVPDRSGNLWVGSESSSTLVMFFGLAAPTATPTQPTPQAP
jgi:hypothetical protein